MSKKEKAVARRREKRKIVLKQTVPTLVLLVIFAIALLIYMCLFHPFVSSDGSLFVKGKCISIETELIYGKHIYKTYVLSFDDGNEFYINSGASNHFDYTSFNEAQQKGETFIVKYRYDSVHSHNSVIEISAENGNTFLSVKDVNASTSFFWIIIFGLYILFGGFMLYFQCLKKYHDNFSNEPW